MGLNYITITLEGIFAIYFIPTYVFIEGMFTYISIFQSLLFRPSFVIIYAQHRVDPDCGVLYKYQLNRTVD